MKVNKQVRAIKDDIDTRTSDKQFEEMEVDAGMKTKHQNVATDIPVATRRKEEINSSGNESYRAYNLFIIDLEH